MTVNSISAVVLIAHDPSGLQRFYASILGISFEKESHDKLREHYVVQIGTIRFIIHPYENYENLKLQQGAMGFYFEVSSLEEVINALGDAGVEILKRRAESFGKRIEFFDPEGNLINVVELK